VNAAHEQAIVAFHEGSHACLHRYFGHEVQELAIRPEQHCKLRVGQEVEGLDYIIGCCAGKAAVDRWYGYKAKSDDNWRASKDRAQALKAALHLSDGDNEAAELLVWWGERRADILVEQQWGQIHSLAFALLEHDSLTGEAVNAILNGSNGAVVNTTWSGLDGQGIP